MAKQTAIMGKVDEDAISEVDWEGHVDLLTDDEDEPDMIEPQPGPQAFLTQAADEKPAKVASQQALNDAMQEPLDNAPQEALDDAPQEALDQEPPATQEEDPAEILELLRVAELKLQAKRMLLDLFFGALCFSSCNGSYCI